MSRKPNLILIPGAWHTGECYDVIVSLLEEVGYSTTALTLPSVGAEPPLTSTDEDAALIRSTVSDLADAGRDVVVVMHSSEKGLEGGVVALVYLCAWMLPEGKSIADYPRPISNQARLNFEVFITFLLPVAERQFSTPQKTLCESMLTYQGDYVHHIDPVGAFYGDLPPKEAEKRKAAIKHHSAATLKSPLKYAAYKHIPTTYLFCTNDQQLPYERQKELVDIAGVKITTVTCDSGHSPFLSQPTLVVNIIRRTAGERPQTSSVP